MILVEEATVAYEVPDGVETVRNTEVVFNEETGHWQLRPESGTVVRVPRERVYRVEGTPDASTDAERDDSPSSENTERETDEYGHPL